MPSLPPKLNFSRKALFHTNTKVCLIYSGQDCSVGKSLNPSNDNLNSTLKSLPKENKQKIRKLTSKIESSNDIDKEKLFLICTIRSKYRKTP